MHYLAELLNINFDNILSTPAFNKIPVKPNSSFKLEKPGIMTSEPERYKTLCSEEIVTINRMTGDVYSQVLV